MGFWDRAPVLTPVPPGKLVRIPMGQSALDGLENRSKLGVHRRAKPRVKKRRRARQEQWTAASRGDLEEKVEWVRLQDVDARELGFSVVEDEE